MRTKIVAPEEGKGELIMLFYCTALEGAQYSIQ